MSFLVQSEVEALTTRLAAAEQNIKDLSDSLYVVCNTLDTLGALQSTGSELDCCISGDTTTDANDRDRFICVGRTVAGSIGMDTAATCPVCPIGVRYDTVNP